MKIQTKGINGKFLDAAVALVEGYKWERPQDLQMINGIRILAGIQGYPDAYGGFFSNSDKKRHEYSPSTRWDQGGSLIEKYGVGLEYHSASDNWSAYPCKATSDYWDEPITNRSPLLAVMQVIVRDEFGEEVEFPEECFGEVKAL